MATITPKAPNTAGISGAGAAFAATAVSGDVIPYNGGDLLIEFDNGHDSSITVNIVPTKSTAKAPGVGPFSVPTRTLVIATTAKAMILLRADEISAYLNASKQIPLTYTSGNTALLVRAISI